MSFKLFKRKPGGTFLGNLVRGAVRTASGGLLGNGALKISQEEYDNKAKFKDTQAAQNLADQVGSAAAGIDANNKGASFMDKIKKGGAKTYAFMVGGVLGVIFMIWGISKMMSKKKTSSR